MAEDRIEEQRRRLTGSSFRRLFMNEWTEPEDRLTTMGDLDACVTLDGPLEPIRGRNYLVGLDLGLKQDRTVAAICHRDEDTVVLDRIEVWQGTRSKPVVIQAVEDWVFEAHRSYNSARVVLDPWQAVSTAQRLRQRGVTVKEHAFTAQSNAKIAMTLHRLLRDRALALPDDSELLGELANVRLRETSPGVYRLDHEQGEHDDRAVALGLAAFYLTQQPAPIDHAAMAAGLAAANDSLAGPSMASRMDG
jgi:phage terminase large subunit-like protein